MSFGISLSTSPSASAVGNADALSYVIERAREAEAAGVDDIWLNQGLDIHSVTVAALVAQAVPRVIVGTAVVPMYPRHPVVLASQAKAAQLAARGRFTLGIGLGHRGQVEGVFGVPFDRPVGHLRDYLRVLRSVLETGTAEVRGATLTADLSSVPAALLRGGVTPRIPLLVAAMGPQALRAAGELADGTLPYLAGPRSLDSLIVPAITAAAASAGRPAPVIAAGVPRRRPPIRSGRGRTRSRPLAGTPATTRTPPSSSARASVTPPTSRWSGTRRPSRPGSGATSTRERPTSGSARRPSPPTRNGSGPGGWSGNWPGRPQQPACRSCLAK